MQQDVCNKLITIKPYIYFSGKVTSLIAYLLPRISDGSTLCQS